MSINIEGGFKNWDYLFSGIEDQKDIEEEEKITKKNVPEEYTCRSKNYNRILNFLFSKTSEKNLDFCCDIQRLLSTPRSEKIMRESEKLVELAKVSGLEHYHDDEIDIYIFKKKTEAWFQRKNK